MASNYTPQGSHKDIQVISPTSVIDTMVLAALTLPSNIYFEVQVPMEAFNAGSGPEYLSTTATGLEELNAGFMVSNVYWTQDLDANGLIADFAVATVTIPTPAGKTGPFSSEVTFPLGILSADPAIYNAVVVPQLEAAVAQLEALAAS